MSKRTGRKPKPAQERRDLPVTVSFNKREMEALEAKAAAAELPVATFAHRVIRDAIGIQRPGLGAVATRRRR